MRHLRTGVLVGLLGLLSLGHHVVLGSPRIFRVEPASSTIEVRTGKAGLFGGFGHSHRIVGNQLSGEIRADPDDLARSSVSVALDASSLKVADRIKESERAEIQHTMESEKVLGLSKFASVRFRSTAVTGLGGRDQPYHLEVTGNLEFHGVSRELKAPVEVTLDGEQLVAQGDFVVRQRDFGIKPYSAGFGVKVANEVRIHFRIVAGRGSPGQR